MVTNLPRSFKFFALEFDIFGRQCRRIALFSLALFPSPTFLHNSSVGKLGMESTPPSLPPDLAEGGSGAALVVTWKWFLAPLVCRRRRSGLNCAGCNLHSHERLLPHTPARDVMDIWNTPDCTFTPNHFTDATSVLGQRKPQIETEARHCQLERQTNDNMNR